VAPQAGDGPYESGQLLAGRYRFVAPIGRGATGEVWRALDTHLDREVAVKEVYIAGGMPDDDRAELLERSLREARIAGRLRHPAIISVHDVLPGAGRVCLVMEFVPSRSLQEVLTEDGPLSPAQVAELGAALLDALRYAHGAGVLHRDVKPSNVLLSDAGRVVLTDFGIARSEGDSPLTRTGSILGSPGFVAPEMARGQRESSPAADLWSLGATLYVAVEGRLPFDSDSTFGLLTAAATADPVPPRNAGPLTPLLAGLMTRDPADRLTGAEAAALLDRARAGTGEAPDRLPPPASRLYTAGGRPVEERPEHRRWWRGRR